MKKLGMNELRKEFLDFYESKGHNRLESFSLVPENDKSLLLINAGMAPLKDYFTGIKKMPKNRACSSQKCIRTADIDRVGKTARHGTFFEMLGNFSFGDYFKREAITWAWEFLTKRLEMDPNLLWVSVYKDDDEAYDIWANEIGVCKEHIVRLGKEDNFWELEVGPCGPCSEIHVDRGEKYGCGDPDCKPGCDCDRFMEVWNLVFTQFNKNEKGEYIPLAHPNIDTGMGLERIALVSEGVDNIFEVELIKSIISEIEKVSGKKYGSSPKVDESIRVISDHTRALMFMISDGVVPSNEGRGYVLRRLMRRAIRHGKLQGVEGKFLTKIAQAVINAYKGSYPILENDKDRIFKIINAEEDRFNETISQGLERLEEVIAKLKEEKTFIISGVDTFKLYDTYGFPVDLTKEIAEENGLTIDEDGFTKMMQEQKLRSREARVDDGGFRSTSIKIDTELSNTEFLGYSDFETDAKVLEIYKDNKRVQSLNEGQEGTLILDKTTFYGEGGGQVGDTGYMKSSSSSLKVLDTHKNAALCVFHNVKVESGAIKENDELHISVDENRRRAIMKNHSCTHLLDKVLKDVIGGHTNQAGSLVDENKLRFDFAHFESISKDKIKEIEDRVNDMIARDLEVEIKEMSLKEATEMGAIGLFEDKYKDVVRVVSMGGESIELCGGTHVGHTSQIQMFKILSETGVSAGVRRIEAITGTKVYDYLNKMEDEIVEIASNIKSTVHDVVAKSGQLVNDVKNAEKELEKLKAEMRQSQTSDLVNKVQEEEGVKFITAKFTDSDVESLRKTADQLRDKLKEAVIVLSNEKDGKLTFVAAVSKDLVKKGLNAGNIVRETAKIAGGNGGGRPDFATAGAKDLTKVDLALENVRNLIKMGIK